MKHPWRSAILVGTIVDCFIIAFSYAWWFYVSIVLWLFLLTALVIRMYLVIDSRLDNLEARDKIVKDDLVKVNSNFTQINKSLKPLLIDQKKQNFVTREDLNKEISRHFIQHKSSNQLLLDQKLRNVPTKSEVLQDIKKEVKKIHIPK